MRHYTRTAGFGTATIQDDAYNVTGSLTGTNRRSVTYTADIQQPLVKKFAVGCARHFTSGTIQITTSNALSMLLSYGPAGTSARDNIASATVNNHTYPIYLAKPDRRFKRIKRISRIRPLRGLTMLFKAC